MPANKPFGLLPSFLALSHGRGNRFLLRVRGCEYSIINCRIYNFVVSPCRTCVLSAARRLVSYHQTASFISGRLIPIQKITY